MSVPRKWEIQGARPTPEAKAFLYLPLPGTVQTDIKKEVSPPIDTSKHLYIIERGSFENTENPAAGNLPGFRPFMVLPLPDVPVPPLDRASVPLPIPKPEERISAPLSPPSASV